MEKGFGKNRTKMVFPEKMNESVSDFIELFVADPVYKVGDSFFEIDTVPTAV